MLPITLQLKFNSLQMQEAKVYHGKLVNLKKEMNALMEKSTKLKVSFQ